MTNPQKYKSAPPTYTASSSPRRGEYKNRLLVKWVLTQNPSIESAAAKIGIAYNTLENVMCGHDLNTRTVNKILAATGYTYEELFRPPQTPQNAHSAR